MFLVAAFCLAVTVISFIGFFLPSETDCGLYQRGCEGQEFFGRGGVRLGNRFESGDERIEFCVVLSLARHD